MAAGRRRLPETSPVKTKALGSGDGAGTSVRCQIGCVAGNRPSCRVRYKCYVWSASGGGGSGGRNKGKREAFPGERENKRLPRKPAKDSSTPEVDVTGNFNNNNNNNNNTVNFTARPRHCRRARVLSMIFVVADRQHYRSNRLLD